MVDIKIDKEEYRTLKEKAAKYDKIVSAGSRGGKKSNSNLTKEERTKRASLAAKARWAKK